jgi:hypothetical protein
LCLDNFLYIRVDLLTYLWSHRLYDYAIAYRFLLFGYVLNVEEDTNVDGTGDRHAGWDKPNSETQMLHVFTHM